MAVKTITLAFSKKADDVLCCVGSVGGASGCVESGWWSRDSGPSAPGSSLELRPRLHCGSVGKAGGSILMSAMLSNWTFRFVEGISFIISIVARFSLFDGGVIL